MLPVIYSFDEFDSRVDITAAPIVIVIVAW
jgi:hypothetical protein